ncbi:MAG: hypothetical protein ACD_28C00395G0006 [uncultured bacterium]|nr:MAG: hypothetical protein ACD_28C00395G0006 [uncultured bacterium]KKT74308.1 MAG: hypothetical protein UW70_C0059G0009 [Candidatus Peregrinibacteria bacterium GW2011_GWA2_44_7]
MLKFLKGFYSFQNVVLTSFLYIVLIRLSQDPLLKEIAFSSFISWGFMIFFLVVIFVMYMQVIIFYEYLPASTAKIRILIHETQSFTGISHLTVDD